MEWRRTKWVVGNHHTRRHSPVVQVGKVPVTPSSPATPSTPFFSRLKNVHKFVIISKLLALDPSNLNGIE
ncbi:unnamed protein product [Prunus armeniaca]|uniref:Uncharacterized protein n=1 Tax=Prunus armeniaca TaxID=36596 RepID=A0A6J5X4V9_PRUAR|nr:unnamed protein product [Prunus armeniaca]